MAKNDDHSAKQGATRRQVVAGTTAAATVTIVNSLAYAQGDGGPVHIKASDVNVEGNKAIISNHDLARVVQDDKSSTVADLHKQFRSLKASQVSLDASGRVVISNGEAAKKLKAFVDSNRAKEKNAQFGRSNIFDNCSCVDVRCH
jgi:hypothetical protein